MAQTYTVTAAGVAFGNNKSMLAVFNGSGSGRILRIKRIWVLNNQTSAVTGVLTTWTLRRITASSGGSAQSAVRHDSDSETVASITQVSLASGATITLATGADGTPFRTWVWSNDEPAASAGTSDELECVVPLNCIFDAATGDADIEPIVLREGEGITVQHAGSTTVGVVDVLCEFTMAAS